MIGPFLPCLLNTPPTATMSAYQQFLASPAIVALANQRLPDDEDFVRFLQAVYRHKTDVGVTDRLSWYLFEEIGWSEGATYCYQALAAGSPASYDHYLAMLRKEARNVDPRLELRRKAWQKPTEQDFIKAHAALLDILNQHAPCPKHQAPKASPTT